MTSPRGAVLRRQASPSEIRSYQSRTVLQPPLATENETGFAALCILMVEDEAVILEIMAESLIDAGYDVVTAADGPSAMAMIHDDPHRFSVLFSDYHLPGGLNGFDIAEAMRAHHPEIPVILATGRPDILEARWKSDNSFVLLRKPYRPSQLLVVLNSILPPHHAPWHEPGP